MKKSAIECYLNLPITLIDNELKLDKDKPIESFETLSNHWGMVRKVEVEYEDEREVKDEAKSVFGFLKRLEAKTEDPTFYEFIERYFNLLETILPNDKKVINRDFELKKYAKPARDILKYYSFDEIKWVFGVIMEDKFWHTNIFNLESIKENWQQIKLKGKERERSKA